MNIKGILEQTESAARGCVQRMARRLRRWWQRMKIARACDEARKRVGAMSREERAELHNRALDTIFPGGRWACAQNHPSVWVAKGTPCRLCAAQEQSPSAEVRDGGPVASGITRGATPPFSAPTG